MKIEVINYRGWQNCYRLYNSQVDLVITTDVGPRIIRFGFIGEGNQFVEFKDDLGQVGGEEWRLYGGHRFWHAPEAKPRSYIPDNGPVLIEQHGTFVRLIQPVETATGIQKELDISIPADGASATVVHRLRNTNLWSIEIAPWALSVMALGGMAIIPLPPRGSHAEHLLPTNIITLWAYTDMSDPRWTWGREYILLRQDPQIESPQKIGLMNKDGWVAYAQSSNLFIKKFGYQPGVSYPDFGCSTEIFTRFDMMEVETLGPLKLLEPNSVVEHIENWYLYAGVPSPTSEADVRLNILPKVKGSGA
jgi:hypothetical protein